MDKKYEALRLKLAELDFPLKYMYKFIIVSDKIAELSPFFEDAQISKKQSSKGNYVSFTAIKIELSPEDIIAKYQSLNHIKGIISL
jgi:putative lipoic acid-binding regulatory protein